jgi:glycosyltransferase involved in cell wall biosynthesis
MPVPAPVAVEIIDGAGWGGTERHVRGLVSHLVALGWKIHLVVSEEGPLCRSAREGGVTVHLIPRTGSLGYLLRLSGLFRSLRPALVHAHSGRLACLAARLAGVEAVVETRHGLPERLSRLYVGCPSLRFWEAWKCRLADRTVAVCRADASWLGESGLEARRIQVIANGVASEESCLPGSMRRLLGLAPESPLLGFVGRFSREKAAHRVLETVAGLLRGGTPVRCVLCGDGPEQAALRRLASGLGLDSDVIFSGGLERAEALIADLDLLLLPSLSEGSPYVLLEALLAGTPVLATPVGGVPEILCGPVLSEGCRPWMADDWTQHAERVLRCACYRPAWSEAARGRISVLREEATAQAVDRLYRELLQSTGQGSPSRNLGPTR